MSHSNTVYLLTGTGMVGSSIGRCLNISPSLEFSMTYFAELRPDSLAIWRFILNIQDNTTLNNV